LSFKEPYRMTSVVSSTAGAKSYRISYDCITINRLTAMANSSASESDAVFFAELIKTFSIGNLIFQICHRRKIARSDFFNDKSKISNYQWKMFLIKMILI
jgi:hypothetical protein